MADRYDFANLSPIEFEGLCVDLVAAETGVRFERFSEGADGGVDGRHVRADGDIILQAKHYKNSTWADLKKAIKAEKNNLEKLNPEEYYLLTSQPLTTERKKTLVALLNHPSVNTSNIWGRSEINACLSKHASVEKQNIKLWLSSSAVLERLLRSDIAVFTESTYDEIERILKVYVVNPSLRVSSDILKSTHCLIISGPPGVGKTTLAQVLAAEYSDEGWDLVSIASIEDGFRAFQRDNRQVFVFDDFLGKIGLDPVSLARDDAKIARFISMVRKDPGKRFILTTRSYILEAARFLSEAIDDKNVEVSEMVLNLTVYSRELKARILYNHLYHSEIDQASIQALLLGNTVRLIVDHRNYMPRIIQWMTDEIRQRDVPAADYPEAFLNSLANPQKIWEKAFRYHISSKARILLYCLNFVEQYRHFRDSGVKVQSIQLFYEQALVEFGAVPREGLRSTILEDALRELKSSFLVIDGDRVRFINPSLLDYLSRETADGAILTTLVRCAPSLSSAQLLWKKIELGKYGKHRAQAAGILLKSLLDKKLEGRGPLHEVATLIGDLIVASEDNSYCAAFREQGDHDLYWTVEAQLPKLIDKLEHGKYCTLPYAKVYARYLRLEIHKYICTERDYAMEVEELAAIASSLASSKVEMSKHFYENFDQAAEGAVDALDTYAIRRGDDVGQVVSDWLESIESIESLTSASIDPWKKMELENLMVAFQEEEEMRRQAEEEEGPTLRPVSASSGSISDGSFSNEDLGSMFSSLKKSG